jgi:oligosaccharyltransferase complex subunit alpha (ribophorin I)
MLQPWLRLPFFAIGLALQVLASSSLSFENTDVVRMIELGGSLVQVTTTYSIKSLNSTSDIYTIALGPEEKRKTSWIQAKVSGAPKPLALEDLGFDEARYQ